MSAGINILTSKKLHGFYKSLNEFNNEIGCKSKTSKESLYIVALLVTTIILGVTFSLIPQSSFQINGALFHLLVVTAIHAIELHYQGHLLSLLIPRINLLETYCKLSLSKNQEYDGADDRRDSSESVRNLPKERKKEFYTQTHKLPDYYNKLIIVYDYLYEAIKWQMLMLLTTTFIITLVLCFFISKDIINGEYTTKTFYWNISYLTVQFIPMFVPCVLADHIKAKVRRLRELLASKLYDNTLSKWDRCTARSLHALMETRNLSFSLFNMFDIDVTLPFKFMALIITYLIIVLQFDKANA